MLVDLANCSKEHRNEQSQYERYLDAATICAVRDDLSEASQYSFKLGSKEAVLLL